MKLITEGFLRKEFLKDIPSSYYVPKNVRLTPAALDFLKARKITVTYEEENPSDNELTFSKPAHGDEWVTADSYINYYTKEVLTKKPEHMTHLFENVLVRKNDPRIILRGKLDTLQSVIIETQLSLQEASRMDLVDFLEDLLLFTREILAAEVWNKPLPERTLIGLSFDQIREYSHYPEKYFQLKQMVLVNYRQGKIVSSFNHLRALSRECELVAVSAFLKDDVMEQGSLILGLNRLSSCFHILMYQQLKRQQQ
ncbi:MAG: cobalamin adenosyltransferase [Brevinema sp.]